MKSDDISDMLRLVSPSGLSPAEAVDQRKCTMCPATDVHCDLPDQAEHLISGMCPKCQDGVFNNAGEGTMVDDTVCTWMLPGVQRTEVNVHSQRYLAQVSPPSGVWGVTLPLWLAELLCAMPDYMLVGGALRDSLSENLCRAEWPCPKDYDLAYVGEAPLAQAASLLPPPFSLEHTTDRTHTYLRSSGEGSPYRHEQAPPVQVLRHHWHGEMCNVHADSIREGATFVIPRVVPAPSTDLLVCMMLASFDFVSCKAALGFVNGKWVMYHHPQWYLACRDRTLVYKRTNGVGFGHAGESLWRAIQWVAKGWELPASTLHAIVTARCEQLGAHNPEGFASLFLDNEDSGS